MIFPDLNLLIYAYNVAAPEHSRALQWLESVMNGSEKVCFCWHTIFGLIRISTTPRMFPSYFANHEAIDIAKGLMESPNSVMLEPGPNHFDVFSRLSRETGFGGPKTSDIHLAALAIEHAATFATSDGDFRYFNGLSIFNPISPTP